MVEQPNFMIRRRVVQFDGCVHELSADTSPHPRSNADAVRGIELVEKNTFRSRPQVSYGIEKATQPRVLIGIEVVGSFEHTDSVSTHAVVLRREAVPADATRASRDTSSDAEPTSILANTCRI
jgi:hypothetical protein